jgi:4-hydroxy-3-polyprenylbenzoate decarboxylase
MMFNKYLVLTTADTPLRDAKAIARLIRECSPKRAIIRGEGIYDVLDHATATCGYGGKIALDLTSATEQEWRTPKIANEVSLPKGIEHRAELLDEWSVWMLFADNEAEVRVEELARTNGVECNCIALFDARAKDLSGEELLWLAAANTDPARDVTLSSDESTVIVDARPKRPGKAGNPARFPNVVVSDPQTIAKVDTRWPEYGLGDFITSPSKRYGRLLLSDKAEW